MRFKFLVLMLFCLTAFFASGQTRRTTRPAPKPPVAAPSPTPTPTAEAPARRVVVKLKDGRSIDADFLQASVEQLELRVAGNHLKIAMDDVAAILISADAVAQAAATPTPVPAPSTGSLAMEAGIIYNMGGNQPVGRTAFALLNASLASLIQDSGYRSRFNQIDLISAWGIDRQYPNTSNAEVLSRIDAAISEHTIKTVTTDFNGRAVFENVQPGSYFLVGIAQTRRGHAIWNVPIEIKAGQNTIILDQHNAASAF